MQEFFAKLFKDENYRTTRPRKENNVWNIFNSPNQLEIKEVNVWYSNADRVTYEAQSFVPLPEFKMLKSIIY